MSEDSNKVNWFVRSLIIGLVVVMIAMACLAFFKGDPQFEISGGLLSLLGLIVVLSISESFDHLSLGTLISLQRRVQEQAAEKETLAEENAGLRGQLLNLVANVQQRQVNATFNAPPESWSKLLGVVQAKEPVVEDDSRDEPDGQLPSTVTQEGPRPTNRDRFERWRAAETVAIRKYLDRLDVPTSERLRNAEFSTNFHGIDPIMDRRIVFDAYVRGESKEHFVEAIRGNANAFMMSDRLYVMLNKIRLYKQAKKSEADLALIFVELEEDDSYPAHRRADRVLEYFQPAKANGFLRVETIRVSSDEIDSEVTGGQQSLF